MFLTCAKSENRGCSGFCSGLVSSLAVQRSDRFTQHIKIRVRVSFRDGLRAMAQQVADVFDLYSGSTETGSKRVAEVVPSEVFDFCFRENLVEPLPGRKQFPALSASSPRPWFTDHRAGSVAAFPKLLECRQRDVVDRHPVTLARLRPLKCNHAEIKIDLRPLQWLHRSPLGVVQCFVRAETDFEITDARPSPDGNFVCLDCGFLQSKVPASELAQLAAGTSGARAAGDAGV